MAYSAAVSRYRKFTETYSLPSLPLIETNLLRYVAYLSSQGLTSSTISNYLSGLRAWVIALGGVEPTIWTPRLRLAVRAVSRTDSPPRQVSPITFPILSDIIHSLVYGHDSLMISSALLIHYFACLRASEICIDPNTGLAPLRDSVLFPSSDRMIFRVISSKTASRGFTVHIGCSNHPICAPCTLRYFMSQFPAPSTSYLFSTSEGVPLDYPTYNNSIKSLVARIGLDPQLYSTHSLRAGAATQAAQSGLQETQIQRLGRWKSDAYKLYMRPEPSSYSHFAPHLVHNIHPTPFTSNK